MERKAFLITPGDGRPTANAFWMEDHQKIMPRVEAALRKEGREPVWLHDQKVAIDSWAMSRQVGLELLAQSKPNDCLVCVLTGWAWPEHSGVIFAMIQERVQKGELQIILICNMKEKAPGYVGARAAVLKLEIMKMPYTCLAVIDPSDSGWNKLSRQLGQTFLGQYKQLEPRGEVEVKDEHRRTASDAIKLLRESGSPVPLLSVNSMTMAQGWPHYYLFSKLGLTPIYIGSNEFFRGINGIAAKRVNAAYRKLKERGLKFEYRLNGLSRHEIDLALRMYLYKLDLFKSGAAGMGTQGQMEHIGIVATDLADSLMMSTISPEKNRPVIDVTEADCEALFTSMLMQAILYVKIGMWKPVGFHDIRHYNAENDTLVLLNSGALSLDFMTDKPGDYSDISVVSQNREVYFLNGGGAILGNMQPVNNTTLARFHGTGSTYQLTVAGMDILPLSWEERNRHYGLLDRWPMGIVKIHGENVGAGDDQMTATEAATLAWTPNHGQHTNEYIVPEMLAAAELLGLPARILSA
ncbi:MAG: hypothetical protein PHO56_03315 [Patescibacteria group bacterium]|nr:hypothetical protein [Patescibacteria group bacterium]